METVVPALETLDTRVGAFADAKRRAEAAPHGPRAAQRRVPTDKARRAAAAFAELRRYFRTSVQLQEALGWSAPTLRSWVGSEGPARPREHSAARVFHLHELASAVGEWVSDPWDVGRWLLEPHPKLGDVQPVRFVEVLGDEGVRMLIGVMSVIAPRERVSRAEVTLDGESLRETLRQLGSPKIADMHGSSDLDLSDFE